MSSTTVSPPNERSVRLSRAAALAAHAALVTMLAACGGGGGGGSETPPPPPPAPTFSAATLLPLATGHRYAYQVTGDGASPDQAVVEIGAPQVLGSETRWPVTTRYQADPGSDDNQFLRIDTDGIRQIPGTGADSVDAAVGPLLLMRSSFSPGDTWVQVERDLGTTVDLDEDGRNDRLRLRGDVVVQPISALDTPAGRLSGVAHLRTTTRLTFTLAAGGGEQVLDVVTEEWYAPNIGLVRRLSNVGSVLVERLEALAWSVGTNRTDTTLPTAAISSFGVGFDGRTMVAMVSFSSDVDRRSVTSASVQIGSGERAFEPQIVWTAPGTAEIRSRLPLPDGNYVLTLGTGITDLAGNRLTALTRPFSIDATGPVLVSAEPANGDTGFPTDGMLRFRYDEDLTGAPSATLVNLTTLRSVTVTVAFGDARTITVRPALPLDPGQRYQLLLSNVRDLAGNFNPMLELEFTTGLSLFALPSALPGTRGLAQVHRSDLDGDGLADVLAVGAWLDGDTQRESGVIWLRQQPGGVGFAGPVELPITAGCLPGEVTSTDVDGDGLRDVVVAHIGGGADCGIEWIRAQAGGGFAAGGWVTRRAGGRQLVLLRLAGQARPGLAALFGGQAWLWTPQGGGFDAGVRLAVPADGVSLMTAGDLNGDGRDDLAMQGDVLATGAPVWWTLLQSPDGSMGPGSGAQALPPGAQAADLLIADVLGDGRPQLLMTNGQNAAGTPRILRWQQDGAGTWTAAPALDVGPLPASLAAADIDGDGRLDLLVHHPGAGFVGLLRQQASGAWESPRRYQSDFDVPGTDVLLTGDFTGDGRIDVIVGGRLLRQLASTSGVAGGQASSLARRLGVLLGTATRR